MYIYEHAEHTRLIVLQVNPTYILSHPTQLRANCSGVALSDTVLGIVALRARLVVGGGMGDSSVSFASTLGGGRLPSTSTRDGGR